MNINDPKIEDVFQKEKPDFIIHLAAQASVITSLTDPFLDFHTNALGTVHLSLLSQKYHVKKFIFASTAAVYGEPSYLPIDEKHPTSSKSFYSLSKSSAESFLQLTNELRGLKYAILRFSNVYGPRQSADGEAGVIAIFINQLLANDSVTIYDGNQTRDFIYVKDVAIACRKTLERDYQGIFNISSCTETTITELFMQIAKELSSHLKPIYKCARTGEIKRSVLDHSKACRELNWHPRYPLSIGLKETIDYYSSLRHNMG